MNVFIIRQTQWGRPTYKTYSEDDNGKWKDMQCVDKISDADILIYFNKPDIAVNFDPDKIFCFSGEPDEWDFMTNIWDFILCESFLNAPPSSTKGKPHVYNRPINHWHSLISHNDFRQMEKFPEKTKDLSWVTTNYGDEITPNNCQRLEGQKLRMEFLNHWLKLYPDVMHLFGRNLTHYVPLQNFDYSHGELSDKWDGVRDFRYTISFESSWQNGYFTGKLIDGILAGCMPIYWGCPDLDKYIPKDSFVRIDLRKNLDDACDEVNEIIKSDLREQNLDAIYEAKVLLLEKWNIWNVMYEEINKHV